MVNLKGPLFTSNKSDWATPQAFFDKLDKFYNFTLDPCASIDNFKCLNYYTIEDNGLLQDWAGETAFVNPPYSRKDTGIWVKKCWEESLKIDTTVVMLLPARTDTRWFHEYCYDRDRCCVIDFIKGRLKFGNSNTPAPFPSMTVAWGEKAQSWA
jgi:phage N-6-adenine-methyltransferase